jgi:hypothetical protein
MFSEALNCMIFERFLGCEESYCGIRAVITQNTKLNAKYQVSHPCTLFLMSVSTCMDKQVLEAKQGFRVLSEINVEINTA